MLEVLQEQQREIRRIKDEAAEMKGAEARFAAERAQHKTELKKLRQEKDAIAAELLSLKEMFARRIALDEDKVERQLREKDEECENWFRTKKDDINKMQSALVIMKKIFDLKRQTFLRREEEQHEKFEKDKAVWRAEAERKRLAFEKEKELVRKEKAEITAKYEDLLKQQVRQQQEYEVKAQELEQQLEKAQQHAEMLRGEVEEARANTEEVTRKLADMDKTNTMFATNSREEQLEQELRRLKRQAAKGGNTDETQALKRELMEYVRFILKLLPASNPKLSNAGVLPAMASPFGGGPGFGFGGERERGGSPPMSWGSSWGSPSPQQLQDTTAPNVGTGPRGGPLSPVRPSEPNPVSLERPRRPASRQRVLDALYAG